MREFGNFLSGLHELRRFTIDFFQKMSTLEENLTRIGRAYPIGTLNSNLSKFALEKRN
jgi:hypothetical protein